MTGFVVRSILNFLSEHGIGMRRIAEEGVGGGYI